jgi:hypothetical protein
MPIPPDPKNTAETNHGYFDEVLRFRPIGDAPLEPGMYFGPVWLKPGKFGGMVWGYWDGEGWFTWGGLTSEPLEPTHWAFRAPA